MDYISALHRGISRLVKRFQHNPFDFLYETDLQALLFGFLVEEFDGETISIEGVRHPPAAYGAGRIVRTIPVKSEYPSLRRFDISIIDPDTVLSYDDIVKSESKLLNDAFWHQPLCAAVELKYCQLGDPPYRRGAGVREDLKKLHEYLVQKKSGHPFLGISILFIQPSDQDPLFFASGTPITYDPQDGVALYIVSPAAWMRFAI